MKKTFIIILSVILIIPLSACSGKSAKKQTKKVSSSKAEQTIVYITKTGTKYHKGNCYCLKSKIKKTLSEVKDKYEPCSICNPPVIE